MKKLGGGIFPELPLLLKDEVSPVPCLDTMKIHIKTLVDRFWDNEWWRIC